MGLCDAHLCESRMDFSSCRIWLDESSRGTALGAGVS